MSDVVTVEYDDIRNWAQSRGGSPAFDKETGDLTFCFIDDDPEVRHISWQEFFDHFEVDNLALKYDDEAMSISDESYQFVDRDKQDNDAQSSES